MIVAVRRDTVILMQYFRGIMHRKRHMERIFITYLETVIVGASDPLVHHMHDLQFNGQWIL